MRAVSVAMVLAVGCAAPSALRPAHRMVVTSAAGHVSLREFSVAAEDLAGAGEGWSVRKTVLHGGKQEGVSLIIVDNGVVRFAVIPERGMSVLDVRCGDVRLGWDSPVREVVHPRHMDLESRAGLGWLEGFNEWMVRCGLEYAGHPGEDTFVNNVGDEAKMMLTLHGRIGNLPASEVEVVVDPDPPHRIRIRGTVHERRFYGPKLRLETEISAVPGEASFRISDIVINEGAFEQEFQVIYHGNFGAPLLEKGAKVTLPAGKIAPMNDHAAKGIGGYDTYAGPSKGFIEQVYLVEPYADGSGRTEAVLRNAAGNRGVSVGWSTKELPYVTVWKNTAAREDGYVTGIEPGTGYPYNRSVERKFGRVPKLKPGAERRFTLDFEIHRDAAGVKRALSRVANIQAGRPTRTKTSPPQPPE